MSAAVAISDLGHCSWCALPKAKRGLIIGVLASILLHVVAFAAVAQVTSSDPEFKDEPRVIYLGEITITVPKKKASTPEPKEI